MVCGAFFVASRLVGPLVPYNAHSIRTMAKPTQAAMIKMGYGLLSEYIGVSFNPSIQRTAPDHPYRSFAGWRAVSFALGRSVLELRHGLQLVLGRIVHSMIGVPFFTGIARRSRTRRSTGRGSHRFVDPLYLVEGHRYVAFAHTEKAADRENDLVRLARLVQNHIIDLANFLVGFVVHV